MRAVGCPVSMGTAKNDAKDLKRGFMMISAELDSAERMIRHADVWRFDGKIDMDTAKNVCKRLKGRFRVIHTLYGCANRMNRHVDMNSFY